MKTLNTIFTIVLSIALVSNSFGQNHDHSKMAMTKTEAVKVWGNCEMCKARIEKAAKTEGVSKAEWNQKTKVLTLVYNPSKVKNEDIQKKISAVGHDTEKFRADDKIFNSLPGCCKFERKK